MLSSLVKEGHAVFTLFILVPKKTRFYERLDPSKWLTKPMDLVSSPTPSPPHLVSVPCGSVP